MDKSEGLEMTDSSVNIRAHIHYEGDRMSIETPYHAGFVNLIKKDTKTRRWNPEKKIWTFSVSERDLVLTVANKFYDVIEDTTTPPAEKAITPLSAEPLSIQSGDQVDVWTDGACLGNPGPGAYAAVISHKGKKREKVGGFRLTTNNRMEIMGVIDALEFIPEDCKLTIYSDSTYLVNAMSKGWVSLWKAKNWLKKKGEKVPNSDLWEILLKLTKKRDVQFVWVKGHNDQPENERCNELAEAFARTTALPDDKGYNDRLPSEG
jgi:ribonuclease HI